jgi:hypothetical protein
MKHHIGLALALAAAGTGAAWADNGFAVGGSIEGQYALSDNFQLRGGYNFFEYGVDDTWDDIAYDGDLDLSTFGAFIDFRPFGGSFFLSAGAFIGDKTLDMTATPTTDVEIGGETFTPEQAGTLNMLGELEETAPFLGLGWDTTFQGSGPWGFKFLLGVMQTGSPEVTLTSSGGILSNDPDFQEELANEEANLEADVEDYEYYPVIQAGVTFAF